MPDKSKKQIKIDRSEPLEMDNRGRVTIPSNIRNKHGIQPDEDKTIWLEVNIEEAEIEHDDDSEGVTG
jgi:bifunctional DNA-binding transcriptional regulator/antitoxin component of YhaV-PrlF toxin-antitoxin module